MRTFEFPTSRVPVVNVATVPQRSPLRYHGGKTWLIPHIREWLRCTEPELLIEPFAGGAVVSLTAVMEDLVTTAIMVEMDRDVAAFWRSALEHGTPQLVAKAPLLRQWGTKLAVAVDRPFFEAIGGPSPAPSQDLNDGDIIWLVPRIDPGFRLIEHHWEVLPLEESSKKLLSAVHINRREFEDTLRAKLRRIGGAA